MVVLVAGCLPRAGRRDLSGRAEDLWGERLRLDAVREDPVLVHPLSPANCGYCLIDGPFIRENYLERNLRAGGRNFHLCLFNPQLDVYTFQKHERDVTPVLTFPPELHRFHRNGFPWMIVFRQGRLAESVCLSPYEESFDRLAPRIWSGSDTARAVTSPIHMASRFVFENRSDLAVIVFPDGREAERAAIAERMTKWRNQPGQLKYESELTPSDLEKNLCFTGPFEAFRYGALRGQGTPIEFDLATIRVGGRVFTKSDVRLDACFPNPYKRSRYVLIGEGGNNAVDCALSLRDSSAGGWQIAVQGFFRKGPDGRWAYDDSLAFGPLVQRMCEAGFCPAPVAMKASASETAGAPMVGLWKHVDGGRLRTCGGDGTKFPNLSVSPDGACWLAWEQRGNVYAADVARDRTEAFVVESDASDSFCPVVAADVGGAAVCYLNDRQGPYRLTLRRIEGGRLTAESSLSGEGPFDAVTPAAAAVDAGRLVVVWSEWRANQRLLLMRTVRGTTPGPISRVAVRANADGYENAWWPSLALDANGHAWAAWNQH